MNFVIDKTLSQTIVCLNSLCIILIVLMHSVYEPDGMFMEIMNHLFFDTITRIAVPLFFVISSILFFRDIPDTTKEYVSWGGV